MSVLVSLLCLAALGRAPLQRSRLWRSLPLLVWWRATCGACALVRWCVHVSTALKRREECLQHIAVRDDKCLPFLRTRLFPDVDESWRRGWQDRLSGDRLFRLRCYHRTCRSFLIMHIQFWSRREVYLRCHRRCGSTVVFFVLLCKRWR